jgi:hypothetical protein
MRKFMPVLLGVVAVFIVLGSSHSFAARRVVLLEQGANVGCG